MKPPKLFLIRAKYSMLIFDILAWVVRVDSWANLRKQSNDVYKMINNGH